MLSVIIRTMPSRLESLDKCLFNLVGQDYKKLEVIIVIQRKLSEDITSFYDLIKIYKEWFENILLIENITEHDERSKNLNIGLSQARGRFIAFLDDDDKVYKNHYSLLISSLLTNKKAWGYTNIVKSIFNEKNQNIHRENFSNRAAFSMVDLLKDNYIPIHSFVLDRDLIQNFPKFDESFIRVEDYDFLLKIALQYEPLFIPEASCEYCLRENGDNSTVLSSDSEALISIKRSVWEDANKKIMGKKHQYLWWFRELESINSMSHYNFNSQHMLTALYASRSWKFVRFLRKIKSVILNKPLNDDIIPDNELEANQLVLDIYNSNSWGITWPLRFISDVARKIKQKI